MRQSVNLYLIWRKTCKAHLKGQLETMSFPKMTTGRLCPEMVHYVMELVHLKTEADPGVFLLQGRIVCPL